MKPVLDGIKHRVQVVRLLATKHVIQRFANDLGLVYFGHVDQHDDDHKLVRGVSLSKDHTDRHYSVGSIQGYDVILLHRSDTIHFPGHRSKHYSWMILQIDLKHVNNRGQLFLDGQHHQSSFYATLFTKFKQLKPVAASSFIGHEPLFVNHFKVYVDADKLHIADNLLTPEATATIAHHFKHLDFEINDDQLFVYAVDTVVTRKLLDNMLRAGLWLARHADSRLAN